VSGSIRKIVSMVVLVGLVLVGGRLLGVYGAGPVPVEIHYLLGDPPVASELDVTFRRGDYVVARFETKLVGPDVAHKTRLPAGDDRLDITLVAANGARRTVQRTITAERDARIRLDLSREVVE
jgi:hypothetical protein